MLVSVGVQSPTEIKASGGWQRCADEDVALLCDAHLADKYAEAYLKRCIFRDNIPLVQKVLRIIINKPDLNIIKAETQVDMKRLLGAINEDIIYVVRFLKGVNCHVNCIRGKGN